ncbi:MAG: TIGR01777 family oxidoreductase [Verrucomicrobiota bacterium]
MAIVGVSGFVGHGLPGLLASNGVSVTGVSRSRPSAIPGIDHWQTPATVNLAGYHAVINLAGESVAQRWTPAARRRMLESRVSLTNSLVAAIGRLSADERPKVLVNASAVGYYGNGGEADLIESSRPGNGYLAELCGAWEAAAAQAETHGVRVIRLRLGIVLGRGGLAYERLRRVFRMGLGGRLGSGLQWMAWIHLADLHTAIVHAVFSESLRGAVNATAPQPERNATFTRLLAAALHRPALLPVPGFALKLALGGFGGALLDSQRALPQALISDGFRFKYPELGVALQNLESTSGTSGG